MGIRTSLAGVCRASTCRWGAKSNALTTSPLGGSFLMYGKPGVYWGLCATLLRHCRLGGGCPGLSFSLTSPMQASSTLRLHFFFRCPPRTAEGDICSKLRIPPPGPSTHPLKHPEPSSCSSPFTPSFFLHCPSSSTSVSLRLSSTPLERLDPRPAT